ncbi:tape measure protein [Microbacterium phage McGalleon]|uniref:Tape measure protein n=1 Tax=Microbacterium phage McGalleon TaxID=2590936 RepID=A0A516KQU5_9CAUD|nr:tail length tape measure protein [Microbacterium phage McGalleon]QDP44070.1 tape measure protein [Microbacterium phage McGalleon]
MADNDVRIKLSLDGASDVQKGLAGVGDEAGKADSKLGGLVSGGLKGAGAALVGFSTAAVAAGGALAAGVVSQYAQYEQNIGGIETMFKDSAGKMQQYAADAYKTAGLSANEYMSQVTSFSAALLQGLGGDTAAAADIADMAMVDMSDNANKFGSNISDIQNAYQGFAKQNFTMLDNLKLGYGGTREEMARLINDSGVMGDSFEATASNLDQVSFDNIIKAIHTVQDEMGIAGTTAKEATETISGSVGMLKGAFDNLLVGLGSADADVAKLAGDVIDSLELVITNVSPVIENIGANIATLGPKLGEMMGSLVQAVASAIPALLNAGVALIGGLITGITTALPSLITALVPGLIGLVESVVGLAPQLITAGIQAISSLAIGIGNAIPTLIPTIINGVLGMVNALINAAPMFIGAAITLIQGLANGLLAAIPTLIQTIPVLVGNLVTALMTALPALIQAGVTLFTSLVTALPDIITQIVAVLPNIITAVINAVLGAIPLLIDAGIKLITALVQNLPAIITAIVGAIPKIITSVINAVLSNIPLLISAGIRLITSLIGALPQIIGTIVGAIPQIIGGIVGAIIGAVPQLARAGLQLIQGLWSGISNAAGWLMGKIGGFVNQVMGGIKSFFGIKSPSRRMAAEVGVQLPAGLGVGVEQNTDAATDSIDEMNRQVMLEAGKIGNLSVSQAVTQQVTAQAVPTAGIMATPIPSAAAQSVIISGPLVSVAEMSVRDDRDIRTLSTQLKTDMTRELRAQGVLA